MSESPVVVSPRLVRRVAITVAIAVIAVVAFYALWLLLLYDIFQSVYQLKAGLDWFYIVFYHGYSFVVAALFGLLLVNPRVGHSDLWVLLDTFRSGAPKSGASLGRRAWLVWQGAKWLVVFVFIVVSGAIPFLGDVMNSVMLTLMGYGEAFSVPRIFTLPFNQASGEELISLMPTLEAQYRLFFLIFGFLLLVVAARLVLRSFRSLLPRLGTGVDVRDVWFGYLLLAIAAVFFTVILGAPYWTMNVQTPFVYASAWAIFLLLVVGARYMMVAGNVSPMRASLRYRAGFLALGVILVLSLVSITYLQFNWNNNYLNYEWYPQTQKSITVTRWSAGLNAITVGSLRSLPTSGSNVILGLVRQWDQEAASVTMTKEIGAYNWMQLASSEIVFLHENEYWVSPTAPSYPSTDWISEHLIYTHASRTLVINTHTGAEVQPQEAFAVKVEPSIYYGQSTSSGGFDTNVYVHVPGYLEVQNASYTGTPDYTLDGWQKSLWFTFTEGQLGFSFSGYPIDMLWHRDVYQRVGDILIPGLEMDPAAYLASDGERLYYVVQLYTSYPIHSQFSASPYLRFFGVALVDISDGTIKGYTTYDIIGTQPDDFLTEYYARYYDAWGKAPDWLIPQLRYPEQLLGSPSTPGQLDYDFLYHVDQPFVWRSGSEFYERPNANTVQYIPWALGNTTYFVGMQLAHFQSAASKNLAGVYIAYGGDRLGKIFLYQTPSTNTTFIGPAAAENALNTNSRVRTELTLLPNYRIGSYLLYSVGGTLEYFVAVYTNPGTEGVVTQLAFMTAIDPDTGNVGVGSGDVAAFDDLLGRAPPPSNNTSSLLRDVYAAIASAKMTVVNATSVNPDVYVSVGSYSLGATSLDTVLADVKGFLDSYGPNAADGVVFVWNTSTSVNLGIFEVKGQGVTILYYITVTP